MFLPAEFDAADVFGGINQDMDKVDNNQLATVSLLSEVELFI